MCYLYLSGLTSAESLKLPENIECNLYLSGLMSAEGLKLPENFDIKKLYAPQYIIDVINRYPEEYYIKKEHEEDLSKVKEQVLNAKHFTDEQRVQATETLGDVEEVTEYRGKYFR